MTDEAEEPPPEARKLPTGRIARTARVGGLVTSQGARWAGMRTANRVRSPERAAAAQNERTAALVNQLVDQLGQMRGAAMKVGQVLSMVEFDGLPEEERDALQAKLAELRDDVPPVPFSKLERLLRDEFGGPLSRVFSEFDERAFAAASIGQVHRATTLRRRRGGRQGPVSGGRGGGRDRSAQRDGAAAAGQAAGAGPRCEGAGL